MASKESSKFKSKLDIKCGYCQISMRRDRLAGHTKQQHPGCSKKEMGEVQSRSLKDMLMKKSPQIKPTEQVDPRDSADFNSGGERGEKRKCEENEINIINKRQKRDETEVEELKNSLDSMPNTPTAGVDKPTSISAKLDEVLFKLSELQVKSEAPFTHEKQKETANTDFMKEIEALQIIIQASKTIRRVCDLAGLTPDEDNNILSCDVCCAAGRLKSRAGSGSFSYDFTSGVDFTKVHQPATFSNLKRSVARHIETRAHTRNLTIQGEENEWRRKMRIQEQSVGVILGKQCYRLLKYCRPFSDYEVDLKLLSDANVKVGNLNHSRKFAAGLRPAFAEAINNRVKAYINTPLEATHASPPIGIAADKLTAKRRTGQMYAGILFTPGMDSLLTPVSLGVTSVTRHDGDGIAEDISDMCKTYSIHSDQIAGFGFDGQYFHLKVPEKLKEKLSLDESVGFIWDPAHLLQLADKDTRKECQWIDDICKDIAAVLSKFSFGKTFEEAIAKASELGLAFKAPQWFSDTRFAAYAHGVFRNFIDNYQVVRQVLGKVAESDDQRAGDACSLLGRIRTLEFAIKLLICCDFYSLTGSLSQSLQLVDHPVWLKMNAVDEYLEALKELCKDKAALPSYNKYESELSKGVFHTQPLLAVDVGLHLPHRQTRAHTGDAQEQPELRTKIEVTLGKATSLAENMIKHVNERFNAEYRNKLQQKQKAASLWPILKRAQSATNEAEMMSSSEVEMLSSMHPLHAEETRNLCVNIYRNRAVLQDCSTEIALYHQVFSQPDLSVGASHVLQKIAKIFCSSPPESIVESMGSIIDKICTVRGGSKTSTNKSDVKDISDELITHWNGPHISNCESIVKQALNIHFKGGPWHFISLDVRAKLHKVSKVVDRINSTRPKLVFML